MKSSKRAFACASVLATILALLNPPSAQAVTISASGTHACDQTVGSNTGVNVTQLANGDCLLAFTSGTNTWTPGAGLTNVRILIVGGGGGGGGSYDRGSAGGGGAGQVIEQVGYSIAYNGSYGITVGSGGVGGVGAHASGDGLATAGQDSLLTLSGTTLLDAFGGGAGAGSRTNSVGAAACHVGGSAATSIAAAQGGGCGGGAGYGGGGGGNTGSGSGGTANAAGGAGATSVILDSNLTTTTTFGAGGRANSYDGTYNGSSGGANTGNGGQASGSVSGGGATGGNGGSGVVYIRYTYVAPGPAQISASIPSTSTYRTANTLSISSDSPGKVTFYANGKAIPGCKGLNTSGSSGSYTSTCNWKPSFHGTITLMAIITPSNGRPVTMTLPSYVSSGIRTTPR